MVITPNNGPESTGRAFDERLCSGVVKPNSIRPGKLIESAYAESFIGRLRDECLNDNWLLSLRDTMEIIGSWRKGYSDGRPHSALKVLNPNEYAVNTRKTPIAVRL